MIVDDSMLARRMLQTGLSKYPNIQVVGEAINAMDARRKIPLLHPDVITMDVEMPGMNGIEFVKSILPEYPIPIILVSSLNLRVFDALAVGAVDFVRKPDGKIMNNDQFIQNLANKIVVASCARVRKPMVRSTVASAVAAASNVAPLHMSGLPTETIIALGASTGGTERHWKC